MKNDKIYKKAKRPGFPFRLPTTVTCIRVAALGFYLLNTQCGGPPVGQFYPDKTYGALPRDAISGGTQQNPQAPQGDAKETPETGEADSIAEQPPVPGEEGQGNKPEGDKGPPPPDGPKPTPPDTVIKKLEFKVAYDAASAVGLRNNQKAPIALNGTIGQNVRSRLVPGPEDGLLITENYGDGKGQFEGFLSLRNSVADANRPTTAASISGLKSLYVLGASQSCPANIFQCAERLVLAPLEGKSETLCFTDPATGKPAAFPIGPKADANLAAIESKLGTFGPFNVRIYPGDVSCDSTGKETPKGPYVTETISAKVSKATLDDFKFLLHKTSPIQPSYGLVFETNRKQGDLVAPYLDETSKLHSQMTYYINEPQKLLVKTIVRSKLSLDIARSLGGGIFAGFIDQLVNLDGVMVDLHYELCKDLLNTKEPDHCSKPAPTKVN